MITAYREFHRNFGSVSSWDYGKIEKTSWRQQSSDGISSASVSDKKIDDELLDFLSTLKPGQVISILAEHNVHAALISYKVLFYKEL